MDSPLPISHQHQLLRTGSRDALGTGSGGSQGDGYNTDMDSPAGTLQRGNALPVPVNTNQSTAAYDEQSQLLSLTLRAELDARNSELAAMQDRMIAAETRCEVLSSQLSAASHKVKQLQKRERKLSGAGADGSESQQQLQQLMETAELTNELVANLEARNKAQKERIAELEAEAERLTTESKGRSSGSYSSSSLDVHSLSTALEVERARNERLSADVARLETQVDSAKVERSLLQRTVAELKQELSVHRAASAEEASPSPSGSGGSGKTLQPPVLRSASGDYRVGNSSSVGRKAGASHSRVLSSSLTRGQSSEAQPKTPKSGDSSGSGRGSASNRASTPFTAGDDSAAAESGAEAVPSSSSSSEQQLQAQAQQMQLLQAERKNVQTLYEQMHLKVTELAEKIKREKEKNSVLQQEVASRDQQLAALQLTAQLGVEHKRQLDQANARLQELEQALTEAQLQYDAAQQLSDQHRLAMESQRVRMEDLSGTLARVRQHAEGLERQLDSERRDRDWTRTGTAPPQALSPARGTMESPLREASLEDVKYNLASSPGGTMTSSGSGGSGSGGSNSGANTLNSNSNTASSNAKVPSYLQSTHSSKAKLGHSRRSSDPTAPEAAAKEIKRSNTMSPPAGAGNKTDAKGKPVKTGKGKRPTTSVSHSAGDLSAAALNAKDSGGSGNDTGRLRQMIDRIYDKTKGDSMSAGVYPGDDPDSNSNSNMRQELKSPLSPLSPSGSSKHITVNNGGSGGIGPIGVMDAAEAEVPSSRERAKTFSEQLRNRNKPSASSGKLSAAAQAGALSPSSSSSSHTLGKAALSPLQKSGGALKGTAPLLPTSIKSPRDEPGGPGAQRAQGQPVSPASVDSALVAVTSAISGTPSRKNSLARDSSWSATLPAARNAAPAAATAYHGESERSVYDDPNEPGTAMPPSQSQARGPAGKRSSDHVVGEAEPDFDHADSKHGQGSFHHTRDLLQREAEVHNGGPHANPNAAVSVNRGSGELAEGPGSAGADANAGAAGGDKQDQAASGCKCVLM